MRDIKKILDYYYENKSNIKGLFEFYDPLQVARKFKDPYISLLCALFAYGSAKQIVKFLNSLDFNILNSDEKDIKERLNSFKYRFQSYEDVKNIFITTKRLKDNLSIEDTIFNGFKKNALIIEGVNELIKTIYKLNDYSSFGYDFFFGKTFLKEPKSAYKRYNMYLRWMVRKKGIDLGLFSKFEPKYLLMPLDTHSFKTSKELGLTTRTTADFKAVMEVTNNLKKFDPNDPIKYDFALYRISQLKEIKEI